MVSTVGAKSFSVLCVSLYMDCAHADAQGAAPSAPVIEAVAAEIPTEADEENAEGGVSLKSRRPMG